MGLLDELAVEFDIALLKAGQHRLGGLDKTIGRFVLIDLQAFVLDSREATSHAE